VTPLALTAVQTYRERTFWLDRPVRSPAEAREFVNARGFSMFWPITGVLMPSLWVATVGDRPVPNEHDDPGHVTWRWKDEALGKRWWYYAKVLRKKGTLISLEVAPYFYALSENFGSPESDYLDQYRQGLLTQEAKAIYEALLREGPLHTLALRKATFMSGKESSYRFSRALEALQADFKILPVGIAEAGAWRYAYIYDCVHRHYPALPEQAREIAISAAQQRLVADYFHSVGAAQFRDVKKVFQWPERELQRAVEALVEAGTLRDEVTLEKQPGRWIALATLLS